MNFEVIRNRLQWLRGEDGVVQPQEAERVMAEVLDPLLFAEGYELSAKRTDEGMNWIAQRPGDSVSGATDIGIEYKHYTRGIAIDAEAVHNVFRAARGRALDRALLIARHGFTENAREAAERRQPVALELFTLDEVGAWIDQVEAGAEEGAEEVRIIVRTLAHELALAIARSPFALYALEWRQVEEMVGRILDELGFKATVTPPSHDGGKDVIAECEVRGARQTYIIELKHWRAGKRVLAEDVTHFVKVVASEKRDGGIFLSTSGFANNAFASLTEVVRQRTKFGGRNKIVSLARSYERATMGLWSPPSNLPEVLFEGTC